MLDGLGDRSCKILNCKTPLEAARTPNLDRLATIGSNGLFHATRAGQCLPSETAHYMIFGYDLKNFPGRGLLEAVGAGVPFESDDVLILGHFASVTWQNGTAMLALGRNDLRETSDKLGELFDLVPVHECRGIRFRLQRIGLNNAIIVASGDVSPFITDSDPVVCNRPMGLVCPVPGNPEPEQSRRMADAMNEYLLFWHDTLAKNHVGAEGEPCANFMATQRSGRRVVQTPFHKIWGMRGMMIASSPVYAGLAAELGIEFKRVSDGPDPGKDMRDRIHMALADTSHEFIHVHTKTPDEAGHFDDPELKMRVIEKLDSGFEELANAAEERDDLLVVVAADHSTAAVSTMVHTGEPVPVLMAGENVRRDAVRRFDEISAAAGCLGFLRGRELMLMALNYADRASLQGLCMDANLTRTAFFNY